MSQFDVYRVADHYVLDCQADILRDLNTRFVVPLMPVEQAPKPATRLNPTFDIGTDAYILGTQFAATIPASELKVPVTSLCEHRFTIVNALGMLISGY